MIGEEAELLERTLDVVLWLISDTKKKRRTQYGKMVKKEGKNNSGEGLLSPGSSRHNGAFNFLTRIRNYFNPKETKHFLE